MRRSIFRPAAAVVAGVAGALVLTACGSSDGDTGDTGDAGQDGPGSSESSGDSDGSDGPDGPAGGQTRTVQHELGETEVPVAPERVVALDPYYSLPTALAAGAPVVGASHQPFEDPFPPYLDAGDTEGIEDVGWFGELNAEQILQLEPDVIVGLRSFVEDDYDRLSQIAPTVALPMDATEWQTTLGVIGEAIGRPDEVARDLADYAARAESVRAEVADAGLADEPVSLLNIRALDDLRVYTANCAAAVLDDVGLTVHLADQTEDGQNSVDLSIERVIDADATTLFYFVGSVGTNPEEARAAYDEVAAHPLWAELEAVQNGRAYPVDAEWWFNCGSTQAAHRILDDITGSLTQ